MKPSSTVRRRAGKKYYSKKGFNAYERAIYEIGFDHGIQHRTAKLLEFLNAAPRKA